MRKSAEKVNNERKKESRKTLIIKKVKKEVKRDYFNSVSGYGHRFINFGRSCFKFNNRTKWYI